MKGTWLHRLGRERLLVFCSGWGMDANPFKQLMSNEYDVYMLFDYRELKPEEPLSAIIDTYKHASLVTWSMGVWVGQVLFSEIAGLFHRTLAINGTLCPIDDNFGIPKKIFSETLAGFNTTTRMKFYRRMCREKTNLKMFLARQPDRSVIDQRQELVALQEIVGCIKPEQSIYQQVIISEYDWIVPSDNQRRFWVDTRITEVAGFHFLFYLWPSWDQLLNFADSAQI